MSLSKLESLVKSDNISETLSDGELIKIADKCALGVKIDEESCADWLVLVNKGLDIAKQVMSEKSTPWEGAANVKYPLITEGAMTFAAREYPQIIRGNKVVEAAVFGKDDTGHKQRVAERISKYMSWQLIMANNSWEIDTHRMLSMLAVVGTVYRKAYFSPITNKPVFELCSPDTVVVNNKIKDFDKARRITHKIYLYKNDIKERINMELFCDVNMDLLSVSDEQQENGDHDEDAPIELHEQHGYLDLDDDGYAEPYIITFHKPSLTVLRIKARYDLKDIQFISGTEKVKYIKPRNYFTDFHFIPSPDGSFHSLGFGTLLYPLNHAINTLVNQMLDAGTLLNMQFGFIGSGCRIKGGEVKLEAGKFIKVEGAGGMDLSKNIYIPPFHEPSKVLLDLMELLLKAGKDIASISDILQGQALPQNAPATSVLALIKQGLTTYNAIHKLVLNSFKKEFTKLYLINCDNLDAEEYIKMTNDPEASVMDFNRNDMDIRPVADPNMASDAQRMAQAQAVMQLPTCNPLVASKMYLEALEVPELDIQQLLPKQLPPQPDTIKAQADASLKQAQAKGVMVDAQAKAAELEIRSKEADTKDRSAQIEAAERVASIGLKRAQTKLYEAQAVAALSAADLDHKKMEIDQWIEALKALPDEGALGMKKEGADLLKPDSLDKSGDDSNGNNQSGPGDNSGSAGGLANAPSDGAAVPDSSGGTPDSGGNPSVGAEPQQPGQ